MKTININNFEEKLFYEKLANGLEVYLIPLKTKKKYFAGITVKYGNQYTKFKKNDEEIDVPSGIAHFLEHKLFERKDKIQPFEFYIKSGTDVNASTSIFYTQYYFSGNNAFLENLEYLLEWINDIYITDETVEKEKGIIIQEARMHGDNPDRLLNEKIRENAFVSDSFGKRVIGSEKDILSITKDDLLTCYNSFYRPDNMFIIISGDFDPKTTINLIKEEMKGFKNPNEKISKVIIEEPNEVLKKYEEIFMNVTNQRVGYNYKLNKNLFDMDKEKIQIYLSMILSIAFGSVSDFRDDGLKNNLFINLGTNFISSDTHYLFGVTAITDNASKFIDTLKDYFMHLKIAKKDFERIRKAWIASEIRTIDSVNGIANNILSDLIEFGKYDNNAIDEYKSLTYEELISALKKINYDNLSIVVISPQK